MTVAEINAIDGVSGAIEGVDYSAALQAGRFADKANPTAAEIQAIVNAVNAANRIAAVVEDIAGNADGKPATASQINGINGVSGAIEGVDYSTALHAGTFVDRTKPTAAEIQTVIDVANTANEIAAVAEDIAGNADGKPATASEINAIDGVSGAIDGVDYLTALQAGTFADRTNPTAVEIQTVIDAVNIAREFAAVVEDIAGNADHTPATASEINAIDGVSGAIDGVNYSIALHAGTFVDRTKPTAAEVQRVINSVNSAAEAAAKAAEAAIAVAKITTYANDNTKPAPTLQDYLDAGITGVTASSVNAVNVALHRTTAGGGTVNSASTIQSIVDSLPALLPAGVTITAPTLTATLVSMLDTSYGINVDGKIASNGLLVRVPYHSDNNTPLNDFTSSEFTIDVGNTSDNDSGVVVVFKWSGITLSAGDGYFNAKIVLTGDSNTYHARQLNLNASGYTAASFLYATDEYSSVGTLNLKVIPGIPDRNFNVQTNGVYEHKFVYMPIKNSTTGKVWLNNNLGADYANMNSSAFNPMQQATTSTDHRAYGSLFQWGRRADGHELINWTSGTAGAGKYSITSTKSNDPSNSLFIISNGGWRVNQDDTLWANESSPNNVCPIGYRLPLDPNGADDTNNELAVELNSWDSKDANGSMSSDLKLPMAGARNTNGSMFDTGKYSDVWSGSVAGVKARNIYFGSQVNLVGISDRSYGMSVRCIKQNTMGENDPLPANITIDSVEANIVSIDDDTPYNPAIDIQGIVDDGSNTVTLRIPYTVENNTTTLPAYSKTVTIAAEDTEDGVADIVATLSWAEQPNLRVGNGVFDATITTSTTYNAKKLDIEDDKVGKVVATFNYPTDNTGSNGTATLKVIPGILDRNFNVQTNGIYEHRFIYMPVTNQLTGRTWLNNNLGAEYADTNNSNGNFNPAQQATLHNKRQQVLTT